MIRKQLIFPLLKEICQEQGIIFFEEPSRGMFGVLIFENGRKFFVKDVNLNLNYASSIRITKNKALTSYFLEKFGYSIPDYTIVYSEDKCRKYNLNDTLSKGLKYAREIGYPIIIKLNDSSQGRGIYKIYDEKQLKDVAKIIFEISNTFQIQKFYEYNDYRVVVLGSSVLSAYQRIPLYVIGDGTSTIEQLLEKKQEQFITNGRDTVIKIDNEIYENLSRLGFNLETKLNKGQKCVLRNVSNLSAGGECVELTDRIHKDYSDLCIKIARDFNLNLCGIDIMCRDLTQSIDKYIVLEINSSPGLDNYAFSGIDQEIYVRELYRKVILFIKNKLCKEKENEFF